ncbi:DUF6922 domain-containing protein [Cecembia calidifontis]|uniref:DUF6922 domain-containing protein n=1 Tax=Cecembia calidifontis TaxID=1187080 RepID=A0A4Q7PDJ6_9BACT|nr:hypothetical protein [Cecembia calidifontis]RZS98483.1 hypothetical protein BC751_4139 [Cecembia calidifontis]
MNKLDKNSRLSGFSPVLFWDMDSKALDVIQSKKLIIERVLEYGLIEDWKLLQKIYGLEEIKHVALNMRSIDDVTLSFLCHFFDLEKTDFRCYTGKQSIPSFWEFRIELNNSIPKSTKKQLTINSGFE